MSLRSKFITFVVILHLVFIALSLILLEYNRYLFVAAELLILFSAAISTSLYRSFLKPLNVITAGVESIRDRDFNTKFIGDDGGELGKLIGVYNSMIDQLRDERVKQQEQHYFLQRLIEATPIGVILLDLDNKIDTVNAAGAALLNSNVDKLAGCSINSFETLPGSELAGLNPGATKTISVNGIQTYKCYKSHFVDRGFHRHFILIEELTQEILTTQKDAYDKVIRMMSHEINNSVGAVNSILDSSLNYKEQLTDEDRADFENALQVAIDRNVGLNRFMSNFADVVRIPKPSRQPYDLNELLRSAEVLLGPECQERRISWKMDLKVAPMMVLIDVGQMQQVLVNVLKNAMEAIGEDGMINISAANSETPRLSIVDNGKGVSSEDRQRLFTPFYSTKRDGQGIGLTLTREILINHGFGFDLQTTSDGLTEFWVELKASREAQT